MKKYKAAFVTNYQDKIDYVYTAAQQQEIAELLVKEYVPEIIKAVKDTEVYIPGGNREVFEAASIFYCILNKCGIKINKDLSKYYIKTTGGGNYIAFVHLDSNQLQK